jgi:hypothetical protein
MPVSRKAHPERCPRGYQWLPDILAELRAREALEPVLEALAEGDFTAILETPFGERYDIPERMWRKLPLAKKVLPRFEDGTMRLHADPVGKANKVSGSVFVLKSDIEAVLAGSLAGGVHSFATEPSSKSKFAKFSSRDLEEWYKTYLAKMSASGLMPSREDDVKAASEHFKTPIPREKIRALRRKLAPDAWRKPGQRPRPKSGNK